MDTTGETSVAGLGSRAKDRLSSHMSPNALAAPPEVIVNHADTALVGTVTRVLNSSHAKCAPDTTKFCPPMYAPLLERKAIVLRNTP